MSKTSNQNQKHLSKDSEHCKENDRTYIQNIQRILNKETNYPVFLNEKNIQHLPKIIYEW